MSGVLRVDTERLRDAAPLFADLSDSVEAVLRRLARSLDAEGSCWGSDESGHTFAGAYQPAEEQIRDALSRCAQRLREVGEAVRAVAAGAAAADDRARQRLS